MTTLRILPALLLLLFLSPVQGEERHYDEANGFSVQLPAGWKSKQTGDDPIEKACWVSPNEDAEASVMMMEAEVYGLADMVEAYKEGLGAQKVLYESKIELSGVPAHLLVTEEIEGIATIHTMIVHGGWFYDFGVFTEVSTYQSDPEKYQAMGRTFRLEEGP